MHFCYKAFEYLMPLTVARGIWLAGWRSQWVIFLEAPGSLRKGVVLKKQQGCLPTKVEKYLLYLMAQRRAREKRTRNLGWHGGWGF